MERQKDSKRLVIPAVRTSDFDYMLPQNRIAKYPLSQRDNSKLLLYKNGKISAERFSNIVNFLPKDGFLVFNDSKVIHARLLFQKSTGANIEIFCLKPIEPQEFSQNFSATNTVIWKCLVGNAKKWKSNFLEKQIPVNNQPVRLLAEKIDYKENHFIIRFSWDTKVTFGELISEAGKIPIPPYLNRDSEPLDTTRYQTIYAKTNGSVAAPTAGLHFTETIFSGLKEKNIQHGFVTLHVSAGTFKPVKSEQIAKHQMHSEWVTVTKDILDNLKQPKIVIAVGTTSLRTLESIFWFGANWYQTGKKPHSVYQWAPYQNKPLPELSQVLDFLLERLYAMKITTLSFSTELIIVPEYQFKIVDGLITNFHQPRSTLLMLVAALTGNNKWKEIYRFAKENDFRFLSYGDSSLLLP